MYSWNLSDLGVGPPKRWPVPLQWGSKGFLPHVPFPMVGLGTVTGGSRYISRENWTGLEWDSNAENAPRVRRPQVLVLYGSL